MFAPLRPAGNSFSNLPNWPSLEDYGKLLEGKGISNAQDLPLRFVAQAAKSGKLEDKYEARIFLKGEVQARSENWHDLFNVLVWLTFPKSKAALNRRHFLALEKMISEGRLNRGSTQDALTLFDEGGLIIASGDSRLTQMLVDFKWKQLFWVNREAVISGMKFFLIGHAIYEKALRPFAGVTGRAVIFPVAADFFALTLEKQLQLLDEKLAAYLANPQHFNRTADLAPVPVLGVPGWNPENERETYYENEAYFRTGRKA